MSNNIYEVVAHTADLQLIIYGKTKEQLFENAVQSMFEVLKPQYNTTTLIEYPVQVTSADIELLLADFLSEALYLSDAHALAFKQAKIISLTDTEVKATLFGSKVNGFEVVEIKAVTYHDLQVRHENNQWRAQVVFDI